eukprot:Seg27.4 transcript_id=Seg27.4/GoldUCD/mRNA.D3Y31 product="5-formyltetrahydrofolate cyclo-ligase" protein_id=Seg27.4/GoldUCD/D3Y31
MQSTVFALKKALRKDLRAKIKTLTDEVKRLESANVTQKLLNSSVYKESSRISLYLSMPTEVDTGVVLKDVFKKGKQCYIPLYAKDDMSMVHLKGMEDYDSLPVTAWNIKQPQEDEQREAAIQSGGLDLIILPGLGFTKNGLRIGRGKGYYDNYLKKHITSLNRKPFTIGLAFSVQICEEIPCTEDDVGLDLILYPD